MSSLEALKTMCEECERSLAGRKQLCPFRSISNDHCEEYETIERDLKAFKIIVKKRIDIGELYLLSHYRKGEELRFYNSCRQIKYKLKQEEYDLLKEVLESEA